MCKVSVPTVKNLVIHFNVGKMNIPLLTSKPGSHEPSDRLRAHLRQPRKRRRIRRSVTNFYVVGVSGHSYTVFPGSGNIIATGIQSYSHILPTVRDFTNLSCLDKSSDCVRSIKVVNSTYVGRVECIIPGVSACHALEKYKRDPEVQQNPQSITITFRSQYFPGARIKWNNIGTVNLFNNGKFVIVGANSSSVIRCLHQKLSAVMKLYWMTSKTGIPCAWVADLCVDDS